VRTTIDGHIGARAPGAVDRTGVTWFWCSSLIVWPDEDRQLEGLDHGDGTVTIDDCVCNIDMYVYCETQKE